MENMLWDVQNPSPLNSSSYPSSSCLGTYMNDVGIDITASGENQEDDQREPKELGGMDEEDKEKEKSTDESGMELVGNIDQRRKRGRPKGSKNKAKAGATENINNPCTMRSHVMETAEGADIVKSVGQELGARAEKGACILSGNGFVRNVTLQVPGGVKTLEGRFQILYLNGSFLPVPVEGAGGSTRRRLSLTIQVAGMGGQTVAGEVKGPLHASGPVIIVAALFSEIKYHMVARAGGKGQGQGQRPAWFSPHTCNHPPISAAVGSSGGQRQPSGWASSPPLIMFHRNMAQLPLGNLETYSSGLNMAPPQAYRPIHQN